MLFILRGYLSVWCYEKAEQGNLGFVIFLCVKREEKDLGVKGIH